MTRQRLLGWRAGAIGAALVAALTVIVWAQPTNVNVLTNGVGGVGELLVGVGTSGAVMVVGNAGVPTDGTSGTRAGRAYPGSVLLDVTNKRYSLNIGTTAAPVWATVGFTTTSLTAAQINALRATPITLVAAPGAGKLLEFVSATLLYDATATAFTVGTNDLAIRYASTTGDIISQTIDTAGFLDQTADQMALVMPLATDNKTTKTDSENTTLVLHNTGAGELTTGTGVMRVKTTYRVWTTNW